MTQARGDAYRRKLSTLAEELNDLPPSVEGLNALERRGVLHAVQVAVDAAMDLAAMAVKEVGREVQDDYHNVEVLVKEGVVDAALGGELRALNGLRNAIVHKYNRFEEAAVLENLDSIKGTLQRFAERLGAPVTLSGVSAEVRRDLQPLAGREVVLHGSVVSGLATPRSDVDVAIVTRDPDAARNRAEWLRLLGSVPDRYDLRIHELLPLPIQVRIAQGHWVVFGDPVELSYYFYRYRRRWKDQARRVRENRFASFEEQRRALEGRGARGQRGAVV